MNSASRPTRSGELVDGIPRDLTGVMRGEIPSLTDEIISEVRRAIPEYARPASSLLGKMLRLGVTQSLTTFIDLIADPSAPTDTRDDLCRRLGRYEAREGRPLDVLQGAYRIGCHVAWRRLMKLGLHAGLPAAFMSALADAVFGYFGELTDLSAEGYREAQRQSGEVLQQWRRQLLRLILEQGSVPGPGIEGLAGRAEWPLPETVTLVAARAPDGLRALGEPRLDGDILADLTGPRPYLLVPGPVPRAHGQALASALDGCQVAIGLTLPLAAAADSLRWARRALTLAENGAMPARPLIWCEDHLVTLWLLSDPRLAEQVVRRQLGMLSDLTPRQRTRAIDTLGAWLETRGPAAEIAKRLDVHPQTVRYRIKQFERAFGDRLAEPEARFALELALRVVRLRQHQAAPPRPRRPADG